MEVYVDDIITKSINMGDHVQHLKETFLLLKKYKMKLNSEKCAFGVSSSNFLEFMVNEQGIQANLQKIKAIFKIKPPSTLKELQSLTERLAALSRFIKKAVDKCF